jgi:hypothetical protein
MAEFMIEVAENSLQEASWVKVTVHWIVLGRTIASRCGSSPTFQGRLHPHLQGFVDGLAEQAISNTLKMETESVSETSKKFHILTRLSLWELFIEFCRHEGFKTDKDISVNLDPKIIVFKKTKAENCFRKWEGIVGTGWSGLRIGTGGGHLWIR